MLKQLSTLKFLEIEFYQTQWNNISLNQIAEKLKLSHSEIATHHFYEEFYRQMKENNFEIDASWRDEKQRMTPIMRAEYDKLAQGNNIRAISIGAGIGLIEMPLIEEGYNIELQECQQNHLKILENRRRLKNG